MDELNYIGQLFRDKFKGQTIEPSDKVWANIQKNIGSSPAIKPKAKFAKYIISGAAVVSLIVASIAVAYYLNPSREKIASVNSKTEQQTQTINPIQKVNQKTISNPDIKNYNAVNPIPKNATKSTQLNNNQPLINPSIELKTITAPVNRIAAISVTDNLQPKFTNNQPNNNVTSVAKTNDIIDEHPKTITTLDISRDTTVCLGEPLILKIKGGISIMWSTGANSEEIVIPSLNEERTYTYRALVQTLSGDTSIAIKVNVIECHPYEQPNAFTPNGDGKNDFFIPNVPSDCSDYSLMIYNRSGVKVFESKVKEKGWDGKFNNEEQREGAYFYVLQYRANTNSNIKTIRGTIVLLSHQ